MGHSDPDCSGEEPIDSFKSNHFVDCLLHFKKERVLSVLNNFAIIMKTS